MKLNTFWLSVLAAASIGSLQLLSMNYLWERYWVYALMWIASLGLPLRTIGTVLDAMAKLLFSLPAAYLICSLRPRKLGIYLSAATVPFMVWVVWADLVTVAQLDSIQGVMGALSVLLCLPAAVLIVRWFRRDNLAQTELFMQGERGDS